jgi:Tc5 transposase DNA-binding domain
MSTTTNQEGRIALAIQAFEKGQFSSLRAAASSYVPYSTLKHRAHGRVARRDSQPTNRKLTDTEESVLLEWIISRDQRGMSPRHGHVQQMANILLMERVELSSSTVGKCWVRNFIRHHNLQSKYNRKYDYQRARCEDPIVIQEWFQRIKNMQEKYGIIDTDIFNFDETGFQIGVIATAKVITQSERRGRPAAT